MFFFLSSGFSKVVSRLSTSFFVSPRYSQDFSRVF